VSRRRITLVSAVLTAVAVSVASGLTYAVFKSLGEESSWVREHITIPIKRIFDGNSTPTTTLQPRGSNSSLRDSSDWAQPINLSSGRLARAMVQSEQAMRWLIALTVMCCDPLAIVVTAAASRGGDPGLVTLLHYGRDTFFIDRFPADVIAGNQIG
jgi:hypothetical protein